MFMDGFDFKNYTQRYIIALLSAGYLALFQKYGYQIALSQAGLIMRQQFFSPDRFVKNMPVKSQFVFKTDAPPQYNETSDPYWSEPFTFTIDEESSVMMVVRNASMSLPISRNPETPFVRRLVYVPPRYTFRPDLRTAFN